MGFTIPGCFNDRLVLGLKGTMSEAELHVLRARLTAGFSTRPSAASSGAACPWDSSTATLTARCSFIPMRPSHRDPHGFRPLRRAGLDTSRLALVLLRRLALPASNRAPSKVSIGWCPPIRRSAKFLANPIYCWRLRLRENQNRSVRDESGRVRKRMRKRPRAEWPRFHSKAIIRASSTGRLSKANQKRIGKNIRSSPPSGRRRREGRHGIAPRHRHLRALRTARFACTIAADSRLRLPTVRQGHR